VLSGHSRDPLVGMRAPRGGKEFAENLTNRHSALEICAARPYY
jgi:hypothetical protein